MNFDDHIPGARKDERKPISWMVTLYDPQGHKVMQTQHDYRPYAQSQADTWRRLYADDYDVRITPVFDQTP